MLLEGVTSILMPSGHRARPEGRHRGGDALKCNAVGSISLSASVHNAGGLKTYALSERIDLFNATNGDTASRGSLGWQ